MSFIEKNWILFVALFVSGAMLLWPLVQRRLSPVKEIGTVNVTQLINRQNAVLLDVREPSEFTGGKLPNAVHIPLSQLKGRVGRARQDDGAAGRRVLRARPARRAARRRPLRMPGSPTSTCCNGGVKAWKDAGLPLESREHLTHRP